MVGHEATRSEKRMHSQTKLRTFVDFLTQGVTEREMRDAEVRRDLARIACPCPSRGAPRPQISAGPSLSRRSSDLLERLIEMAPH